MDITNYFKQQPDYFPNTTDPIKNAANGFADSLLNKANTFDDTKVKAAVEARKQRLDNFKQADNPNVCIFDVDRTYELIIAKELLDAAWSALSWKDGTSTLTSHVIASVALQSEIEKRKEKGWI